MRLSTLCKLLCAVLIFAALPCAACAADPDALWKIVHDHCVPAAEAGSGVGPCASVDLARRVAVLKDQVGVAQYLLIPTDRIPGIESAAILAPGAPNYWEAAWEARRLMADRLGKSVPREDVGLAINSAHGRSQNQLHIHVDCIAAEVRNRLRQSAAAIGIAWTALDTPLAGHRYRARRLDGEDLTADPFALLAEDGDAAAHMGDETLVVVGWEFASRPGFILLADRAKAGDRGSGEELLDHGCALLD